MALRSRSSSLTPGRSALLTTKTSATSRSPALWAWTASPAPGFSTTTVVSADPAISTSTCPTPTVSTSTMGKPAASSTRMASGLASASPPSDLFEVAMERMNTPRSRACSCMRTRSPRKAPPENGEEGSTARIATSSPAARMSLMSWSVRVDFPAPGGFGRGRRCRPEPLPLERQPTRFPRLVTTPLDQRDQPRHRRPVPAGDGLGQLLRVPAAHPTSLAGPPLLVRFRKPRTSAPKEAQDVGAQRQGGKWSARARAGRLAKPRALIRVRQGGGSGGAPPRGTARSAAPPPRA